jgi:hypothetical protein
MSISSADDLHPSEGARFLLQRMSALGDSAHYLGSVFTPTHRFDYDVDAHMDGTASLRPRAAGADDNLEKRLQNLAASVARQAKAKKADDLQPWPERVLRWRGPGRG